MGNPIEGGVLDVNPFCDCQSGDIYVGVVPSSPETSTVWNSLVQAGNS